MVDAETKYKAKNFIDTVLQRGSDLVGIGLVTLAHAAGFGLVGYAWVGAALMLPAIAVSLALGRGFRTTQRRHFVRPGGSKREATPGGAHDSLEEPEVAADAAGNTGAPCRIRGFAHGARAG